MSLNNFLCRAASVLWMVMVCAVSVGAHAAEGLFPRATVLTAPPQPTKVPEFDFVNLQGGALKSSELKGKVIIIRFWATWWDICRGEMPSVQKAHKEYPEKDVVVMTVSLDGGEGSSVKQFLNEHKYTMPSAHDKGMAYGRKISVRGVPSTFIIDRNQNIVASGMGPLDLDRADVKKLIRSLLVSPRS